MAQILVIEDQPAIGLVFNVALSEEGHVVDVVRDGKTGLDRLHREPTPDIVLVDLIMPGMRGKDVVQNIRLNPRLQGIPVVIISGSIPSPEVLPPQGSYQAFINKPFDIFEVVDTVNKLVADKQAHSSAVI